MRFTIIKPALWVALGLMATKLGAQNSPTPTNSISAKPSDEKRKTLLEKYDLNHNGKIDVQERQSYIHDLANLTQQTAKSAHKARMDELKKDTNKMPALLKVSEKKQPFHSAWEKYDTNKNGRLDPEEQKNLQTDWIKKNGDIKQIHHLMPLKNTSTNKLADKVLLGKEKQ